MVLTGFTEHENRVLSTANLKDSTLKMVVVGYAIPICILAVVVANLVVGKVYVLPDSIRGGDVLDRFIKTFSLGWEFAGVVTIKTGLAAALFSWYGLANHVRTERWAEPALFVSIVVILVGMGLLVWACFA